MSRRHRAKKRVVYPDPKFNDVVISKFMNSLMLEGKKSVAESIVYSALDTVESKMRRNPIEIFHEAMAAVKPAIEPQINRSRSSDWSIHLTPNQARITLSMPF